MLSNQELFDKVVRHLVAQGAPSHGETEGCMYLNQDGLKCAAGCLISEDIARILDKEKESAWARVTIKFRTLKDVGSVSFIGSLQMAHDSQEAEWRSVWYSKMKRIAAREVPALTTSVLDELATPAWLAYYV